MQAFFLVPYPAACPRRRAQRLRKASQAMKPTAKSLVSVTLHTSHGLRRIDESTAWPGGASAKTRRRGKEPGVQLAWVRRNLRHRQATSLSGPLQSWADAETALARLAELDRELEQIDALEADTIARAQADAEARRDRPAREQASAAGALERFSRRHLASRGDLTSVQVPKSRRLLHGRVGYRTSHAVLIRSEAAALRSLAGTREGRRFLRVSKVINREGLRAFLLKGSNARVGARLRRRLQQAGVRLGRRDYWFYELNRDTRDPRG